MNASVAQISGDYFKLRLVKPPNHLDSRQAIGGLYFNIERQQIYRKIK